MDDVDLRTAEWHKFFTPGKAPLTVVLASHHIDLPSQLANCEISSVGLHGSNITKTLLDSLRPLPFHDASRGFSTLSEDVVAVVRAVENGLWNPVPLVGVVVRKTSQFAYMSMQGFALDTCAVFTDSVESCGVCFSGENVLLAIIWTWLFEIECEYFLEVLLKVDDKCENPVILQSGSEMSSFFNEYFIEVGIVVFEFIEEVSGEYWCE